MATRKASTKERDGTLADALRKLTLAHATLAQSQALTDQRIARAQEVDAELRREQIEAQRDHDREVAAMRAELAEVRRQLAQLAAILVDLPEAIRDRIGFGPTASPET